MVKERVRRAASKAKYHAQRTRARVRDSVSRVRASQPRKRMSEMIGSILQAPQTQQILMQLQSQLQRPRAAYAAPPPMIAAPPMAAAPMMMSPPQQEVARHWRHNIMYEKDLQRHRKKKARKSGTKKVKKSRKSR